MSDLDFLRGHIPGYAGYADLGARHQVDQQIRAYLGEALVAARERLRPAGAPAERLEALLLRCEFSDQRVIRAADEARLDPPGVERVQALDRALVELAERARELAEPAALAGVLDEAERGLDERFGALADAHRP